VIEARFGHVNLVARDWRRLADFYTRVLGCEFVPPERDWAYVADPEGNLVELQAWSDAPRPPER
jgi:catechol-2,3-dioxygenase